MDMDFGGFCCTFASLLFLFFLFLLRYKPKEFPYRGYTHVAQLGSTGFYEKNRSLREQFWIFVTNSTLLMYKLLLLLILLGFMGWIMD